MGNLHFSTKQNFPSGSLRAIKHTALNIAVTPDALSRAYGHNPSVSGRCRHWNRGSLQVFAAVSEGLLLDRQVLAEAGEPVDLRVTAKPGELPLGVAARG